MLIEQNDVIKVIRSHRSIRKFTKAPVDHDTLAQLLNTAQCSSTSSNVQAYSVVHITDAEKRAKIAELAGNQKHVIEAPAFLVFCIDLQRLTKVGEIGGAGFNTDYMESFLVGAVDVALFAQTFMIAAESIGLGGVYVGGIRNQTAQMIDLLKLPELTFPLFGMCIGYPDEDRLPDVKPRLATEVILHENEYSSAKNEQGILAYDEVMNTYFMRRDSNRKDITWSSQISKQYGQPRRVDIRKVLEDQKFGLK